MKLLNLKSQKGSAVLEAALILPILLMLLSGLVEFGEVFRIQQALTNAAREGARIGAIRLDRSTALSEAGAITTDYLVRTGVNTANVTIDPKFSYLNGTEAIEVFINYSYASRLTAWAPGLDNLDLKSRVIMRREA